MSLHAAQRRAQRTRRPKRCCGWQPLQTIPSSTDLSFPGPATLFAICKGESYLVSDVAGAQKMRMPRRCVRRSSWTSWTFRGGACLTPAPPPSSWSSRLHRCEYTSWNLVAHLPAYDNRSKLRLPCWHRLAHVLQAAGHHCPAHADVNAQCVCRRYHCCGTAPASAFWRCPLRC